MQELPITKLERPNQHIKVQINALSADLKNKVKTGLTIFYTTHILSEAEYLCDEIAIIDKGKILTVDTPEALKNRFGKEKTIKIHLLEKQNEILTSLTDCLHITYEELYYSNEGIKKVEDYIGFKSKSKFNKI